MCQIKIHCQKNDKVEVSQSQLYRDFIWNNLLPATPTCAVFKGLSNHIFLLHICKLGVEICLHSVALWNTMILPQVFLAYKARNGLP